VAEERAQRRLAAILAADVVGYSRLMGLDEAGTLAALKRLRKEVLDPLVAHYQGRVFKVTGDGVLVEFTSAVNAVVCGVELQKRMAAANEVVPEDHHIILRIGVNLGDVVVEGGDLYGDGVIVAARLEGIAESGSVLVSGAAYDQVKNKASLSFDDLGAQSLKNISEPVRVYRVTGLPIVAMVAPALIVAKPSVAVLPFVNLSGDPEQQYFSDGMTQDLIGDLSKISGLFVIAHNSVLEYRARPVNLETVSRELGVRYVVDGSTRKAGDRIRVAAELLDTKTGSALWSERYDRDLKDIFSVQDEITRKIAADLDVEVQAAELKRVRRIPTENLSAYDSFLRGTDLYRRMTPESHREAQRMFERAVELDPKFATAYAALGFIKLDELGFQWARVDVASIRVFAEKALSADDSDPMAHILSAILLQGDRKIDRAESEAKRAMALDPNNANVRAIAAGILSYRTPNEALAELEFAMKLNPRYPPYYLSRLGAIYSRLGRYQEAIEAHKKALAVNPNWIFSRLELATIYRALGREGEARNEDEEARRLSPNRYADILVMDAPTKAPTAADASGGEQLRHLLSEPGRTDQ